jgi:hypothetical protein
MSSRPPPPKKLKLRQPTLSFPLASKSNPSVVSNGGDGTASATGSVSSTSETETMSGSTIANAIGVQLVQISQSQVGYDY